MLYSRHLQIADPFSETGQIIVKTLQKTSALQTPTKSSLFGTSDISFTSIYQTLSNSLIFFSRENALVKKN